MPWAKSKGGPVQKVDRQWPESKVKRKSARFQTKVVLPLVVKCISSKSFRISLDDFINKF